HAITAEPVDFCLQRGILSDAQHKAGRRLAWLYRLLYGKPWVTAIAIDDSDFGKKPEDSEAWLTKRQQEWHAALHALTQHQLQHSVLDICVYQQMPNYFYGEIPTRTGRQQITQLQEGLS